MRGCKVKEEAEGHLRNYKRGNLFSVKFCLDGTEVEVLRRAKEQFPDLHLNEIVLWFRAQGLRFFFFLCSILILSLRFDSSCAH